MEQGFSLTKEQKKKLYYFLRDIKKDGNHLKNINKYILNQEDGYGVIITDYKCFRIVFKDPEDGTNKKGIIIDVPFNETNTLLDDIKLEKIEWPKIKEGEESKMGEEKNGS
jgi:hypothetical protein